MCYIVIPWNDKIFVFVLWNGSLYFLNTKQKSMAARKKIVVKKVVAVKSIGRSKKRKRKSTKKEIICGEGRNNPVESAHCVHVMTWHYVGLIFLCNTAQFPITDGGNLSHQAVVSGGTKWVRPAPTLRVRNRTEENWHVERAWAARSAVTSGDSSRVTVLGESNS